MIFSKKLRKTAACVLALVMVFAMSTGAFAAETTGYVHDDGETYVTKAAPIEVTAENGYYDFTVNYVVAGGTLPEGAQVSIIALGGFDINTDVANVVVEKNGDTATNVLWIDQYDATVTNGSVKVTVAESAAIKTAGGFWIKSGITGGNTMAAWVAVEEESTEPDTPVTPPASAEVTISAITVGDKSATINGTSATITLDAAIANTSEINVTAAAGATYEITDKGNDVYEIVVTAEDKTTTETYTLTVTVKPAAEVWVILYGDANGDGAVTGADVTLVAKRAVSIITYFTRTSDGLRIDDKVGDVNGDGAVTGADVTLIAKRAVSIITKFTNNSTGEELYDFTQPKLEE